MEVSYMSAYNFLEREAGGKWYRAMLVCDIQSAAEAAVAEFEHDEDMAEYVVACRRLVDWEPINFDRAAADA